MIILFAGDGVRGLLLPLTDVPPGGHLMALLGGNVALSLLLVRSRYSDGILDACITIIAALLISLGFYLLVRTESEAAPLYTLICSAPLVVAVAGFCERRIKGKDRWLVYGAGLVMVMFYAVMMSTGDGPLLARHLGTSKAAAILFVCPIAGFVALQIGMMRRLGMFISGQDPARTRAHHPFRARPGVCRRWWP